mmetsp:Transcript_14902/g.40170  ORF Transcript_14902/g.40170 Transcript_14902/m.40170 type:complete len:115 (+) Transcript_14902:1065-1409(+)
MRWKSVHVSHHERVHSRYNCSLGLEAYLLATAWNWVCNREITTPEATSQHLIALSRGRQGQQSPCLALWMLEAFLASYSSVKLALQPSRQLLLLVGQQQHNMPVPHQIHTTSLA